MHCQGRKGLQAPLMIVEEELEVKVPVMVGMWPTPIQVLEFILGGRE